VRSHIWKIESKKSKKQKIKNIQGKVRKGKQEIKKLKEKAIEEYLMKATKGMTQIQAFMLKENYYKERGRKKKGRKFWTWTRKL
jgi:hypothetical protein